MKYDKLIKYVCKISRYMVIDILNTLIFNHSWEGSVVSSYWYKNNADYILHQVKSSPDS